MHPNSKMTACANYRFFGISFIAFCFVFLFQKQAFAQSVPQRFSYQSVIRDDASQLLTSQSVGIRLSILQGTESGNAVYVETHTSNTSSNGLVSLQVGGGTVVSGAFAQIDWASGPYFIKTETDPAGGTNYSITGTSQMLSVPYALFSANGTPGPQGPAGATGAQGPIGQTGPSGSGCFVHYPGEAFGGGVVFHVYKDGSGSEHGLIVALTSQSISQAWSNITDQLAGATSMWDGLANSNAIVAQAGHTSSAAKLCLDYQAGGFTDWYLPSNAELNILWNNVFNVNMGLSVISGATPVFPTSICCTNYWSSSEGASSNAWNLYNYGYVNYSIKGTAGQVRAVRAF
jgi:hypothetical protein